MTGPTTSPVGAEKPRGKDFYQSGPWLILFGHGPESEVRAREIAAQCEARAVAFELVGADEVNTETLRYFMGLVVVLPSASAGERARSLSELIEIIKAYRARRPDGLTALIAGRRRWFEVGVVQVFDDAGDIRHDVMSIMDVICHYHQVEAGGPLAPFAPYEIPSPPGPQQHSGSSDHLARSTPHRLRATLMSWGIDWSLAEVRSILGTIQGLREIWENPTYVDLHRPIAGAARNRFDFLLDDPSFFPSASACPRKRWMEGGQRVVTRVLEELQKDFPQLNRPADRAGKRGLQKDFQELVQALRAAEGVLTIQ